ATAARRGTCGPVRAVHARARRRNRTKASSRIAPNHQPTFAKPARRSAISRSMRSIVQTRTASPAAASSSETRSRRLDPGCRRGVNISRSIQGAPIIVRMLPATLATGTAALLAVGGLLACLAGYRLFRLVLGIYGFFFGAFIATSIIGASDTWTLVIAALAGGLAGALLMLAAYFLGVGLIGAGLAALALNVVWRFVGETPPPTLV